MGRMRLFTKRMSRFNTIGGGEAGEKVKINTAAGVTYGTLTITTATITTANVTTISGATGDVNKFTADVKLVVPTTAYSTSNVTEGSVYTTGNRLYVARGGLWKSGFTLAESTITKLTASNKLILPTTAYAATGVTEGAIYATGGYLYVARGGAWVSGAGGFG